MHGPFLGGQYNDMGTATGIRDGAGNSFNAGSSPDPLLGVVRANTMEGGSFTNFGWDGISRISGSNQISNSHVTDHRRNAQGHGKMKKERHRQNPIQDSANHEVRNPDSLRGGSPVTLNHCEILSLHLKNLIVEIQETELMLSLYEQQQQQRQRQRQQQEELKMPREDPKHQVGDERRVSLGDARGRRHDSS